MPMSNYNHEEESEAVKQIFADLQTQWNEESSPAESKPGSKERVLVGDKYVSGLPINTIRHLIIPSILAFLLFKNLSSLFAGGSGMMMGLNVVSIMFFTFIAVYTSFNFLKAQIALRASTFEKRACTAKISLKKILLEGGEPDSSFLLKRQALMLELVAGLVLPTMVFMVVYLTMHTLNIYALNIVCVVLALVFVVALLNRPINAMRARAMEEMKRFM